LRQALLPGVLAVVVLVSSGAAHAAADAAAADVASPLEHGLARFRARDFAGALPALERAHAAAPDDLDAALVLGITYYRLGRGDAASPLLEAAARSPDAETAGSAKIFLGLLADARGDQEGARAYFQAVASSPAASLARAARTWLEREPRVGRPERFTFDLLVRPELDSNVALVPDAPGPPSSAAASGDADLLLLAALGVRPFAGGLVLEDSVSYRQQARLTRYDLATHSVGVRQGFGGAHQRLTLAYHFDSAWLAGATYSLGHVAEGRYLRHLTDDLGLGGRYTFAYRDYRADGYVGYSGVAQVAALEASLGGDDAAVQVEVAAAFVRDDTTDAALTNSGAGGRFALAAGLAPGVGLLVNGAATARRFDPAAMGRQDLQLRGDASLYLAISPALAVVVGGSVSRNASTDAASEYLKLVGFVGLSLGYVKP
jgi:tetratricopeptide (TPR) repeat protein